MWMGESRHGCGRACMGEVVAMVNNVVHVKIVAVGLVVVSVFSSKPQAD